MIAYLKTDYMKVREAMKFLTKGKAPEWAIALYYVVAFLIGLLLAPVWVVLWIWFYWRINKDI